MTKRPDQTWRSRLDLFLREGVDLISRGLPKATVELEKRVRQSEQLVKDYRQRRRRAAALVPRKARLLWLLPLPLIPAAVIALGSGRLTAFLTNAGAYSLFVVGAILARRGFLQEVSQQQQKFQTSQRWPFKAIGGATVGLATALTAWAGAGHNLPVALAFGAGAFVAFVLLYGLDPRRQALVVPGRNATAQRVSAALEQAEQKILLIEQACGQLDQPELKQRLTSIVSLAREILTQIARDPRDLQRARKFLNTYLDGAQRVASGYAEAHVHDRAHQLEGNFRRVLVTIEEVFEQQHQRLLENDLRDLDVQMEVLQTQLKREGLN
ncbi:MAG TPA: 5-bromo-4-chloroindolyl phosphate hydrolysis family protein [Pelovirga sp.]|nr:5-bromo-4-chloroindolyl phosphate hydrolysis family protein [Pelovirga sp.]